MAQEKEESDDQKRQSIFTIPVPYIAIGFAIFSAGVTAVDYTLGRIEDNTKEIAVQSERLSGFVREHATLQTELSKVQNQLESFKSPGARFTAEDGERLRAKIEDIQQRLAVLETLIKSKAK